MCLEKIYIICRKNAWQCQQQRKSQYITNFQYTNNFLNLKISLGQTKYCRDFNITNLVIIGKLIFISIEFICTWDGWLILGYFLVMNVLLFPADTKKIIADKKSTAEAISACHLRLSSQKNKRDPFKVSFLNGTSINHMVR